MTAEESSVIIEKPLEPCPDCLKIGLKKSKHREWCIVCGYLLEK